jgi:hypothetical protein
MTNYIRYNIAYKTYSFPRLSPEKYMKLTSDEKVEYLEQLNLWVCDDDDEKLEELINDAKMQALLNACSS